MQNNHFLGMFIGINVKVSKYKTTRDPRMMQVLPIVVPLKYITLK